MSQLNKPKILVWDIETSPMITYNFERFNQNIGLDQIKEDWYILAWGAKWLGDSESNAIYMDNRNSRNPSNDKKLVKSLIKLLEQADVCITHNGDKFDIKRVNTRAVLNNIPPYKHPKSSDTYKESKRTFSFTSNSLDYVSTNVNTKYKKLKHTEYPGLSLWKEVMKGNIHAWDVMKKYCLHDVFATEEYFIKIQGWIKTQNLSSFFDDLTLRCYCGSKNIKPKEIRRVASGHFQGYKCSDCGKRLQGKLNLLSKEKRESLLKE